MPRRLPALSGIYPLRLATMLDVGLKVGAALCGTGILNPRQTQAWKIPDNTVPAFVMVILRPCHSISGMTGWW